VAGPKAKHIDAVGVNMVARRQYEYELGQYGFAGQYQQSPVPRKGGIFKREYWQPYVVPSGGKEKGKWPDFDFVLVSVDSAFTEKEENDPTGCTTWGVWTDPADGYPKVMLIMAWRKHLPLHPAIFAFRYRAVEVAIGEGTTAASASPLTALIHAESLS
jgi:hypothetical protein